MLNKYYGDHFFSALPVNNAFKDKPLTDTTQNRTPGISPFDLPFLPNPDTKTLII